MVQDTPCLWVDPIFLTPDGPNIDAERRAKRQILSCGFVEYFCVAKPQKRDLKTVQPRSGDV